MLVEDLARIYGFGKQIELILFDFPKAFDKVNHSKLIWKLHNYGIRSNALGWIRAFLGDRSQRVPVGGEESDSVPVASGFPRGLSYDRSCSSSTSMTCHKMSPHVRLFADDTAMYLTMEGANDSSVLQQDFDRLSVWESNWDMEFNPFK